MKYNLVLFLKIGGGGSPVIQIHYQEETSRKKEMLRYTFQKNDQEACVPSTLVDNLHNSSNPHKNLKTSVFSSLYYIVAEDKAHWNPNSL